MNYFEYLKTKNKFLVIWFIIHGLALFVNIFNIEGRIYSKYLGPGPYGMGKSRSFNLFTAKTSSWNDGFWPFADFLTTENDYNGFKFKGVFFDYGIAEFIAYSVLIFIIYYFKYESQKRKS